MTNVPLWCGMLTGGEGVHVGSKEHMGKSLYFLVDFAVILKLLLKK